MITHPPTKVTVGSTIIQSTAYIIKIPIGYIIIKYAGIVRTATNAQAYYKINISWFT